MYIHKRHAKYVVELHYYAVESDILYVTEPLSPGIKIKHNLINKIK